MKLERPVKLSPVLWAFIDDARPAYGTDRHEVLTFILHNWFATNGKMVREYKADVEEAVRPLRRRRDTPKSER